MEDHARSDTARDHVPLFRGLHGKALLYRWPGDPVWDRNAQRADISAVVVEWRKTITNSPAADSFSQWKVNLNFASESCSLNSNPQIRRRGPLLWPVCFWEMLSHKITAIRFG